MSTSDNTSKATEAAAAAAVAQNDATQQQQSVKSKGLTLLKGVFPKGLESPLMMDLEEQIVKNRTALDELEKEFNVDTSANQSARLTKHIPDEIKGNGQSVETILKNLDKIFSNAYPKEVQSGDETNNNNESENATNQSAGDTNEPETNVSKRDKLTEVTCLASSICSYLNSLNNNFERNEHVKEIADEIYSNVNFWLAKLFRFRDSNLLFHLNDYESVLRLCNLVMNIKYDNLKTEGYKLFVNQEPVFYISASSKYAQPEYREKLCYQLGLPLSCFQLVEVHTTTNSHFDKINVHEFVLQVERDLQDNKLPHLLIANAGSFNTGQCDDIGQLERVCLHYKIWLHFDGVHLSTLPLYSVPTKVQPAVLGDSITLDFGNWIGVPNLANVTMYKNIENAVQFIQSYQSTWDCLPQSLPYWCVLQAIGHQGVLDRIKFSSSLSKVVSDAISKNQPFLKVVVFKDDPDEQVTQTRKYTFQDLIGKAISMLTLVELQNSVVVFKINDIYIKNTLLQENIQEKSKIELNDKIDEEHNEYCNTLTSWLCDLLNSLHKKIRLDVVNIEPEGVCIRYSPVDHANVLKTSADDIKNFIKSFEDLLVILDASIKCKAKFDHKISVYPNLVSINIPKWAGIGAVRYIPDYLLDKMETLDNDESFKEEINNMNSELVKVLQTHDGAFSLGQTGDGLNGVKFGMVNDADAVEKLGALVQQYGKSIEESSKFIEKMTEVIRVGIEKANEDLKKESEKKLQEEGILRQIPIVGGLLNWWSPISHPVTGRAFNLQSGKVETTEMTYKYHMQVNDTENNDESLNDSTSTTNSDLTRRTKSSRTSSVSSSAPGYGENISNTVDQIKRNDENLALLNIPK